MEIPIVVMILLTTNFLMWLAMRSFKPKACPVRTRDYTLDRGNARQR